MSSLATQINQQKLKRIAETLCKRLKLPIDIEGMRKGKVEIDDILSLLAMGETDDVDGELASFKAQLKGLVTPQKRGPGRPPKSPKAPGAPKKTIEKKRKYNRTNSVLVNNNVKKDTMKEMCEALDLTTTGNKDDLAKRIAKAFGKDSDAIAGLNETLLKTVLKEISGEPVSGHKTKLVEELKEICNI